MNAHLPESARELLNGQGIVEILGIARVDGAGEHVAEVFPLPIVLLGDFTGNLLGGLLHRFRIFIGQSVLRQYGVHLHIVVAALAQDVHHLAHRILALAVGPLRDAHHSLVVGLAPFGLATRNDDVVGKHIGLRHEIGYVPVHLQPAHKGVFGTVEHLYHLRLLDVILAAGHKGNLHPVAAERTHRVALRHEDGFVAAVGYERVFAVLLAYKPPLLHLSRVVEPVAAVGDAHEKLLPRHLLHDVDGQHLQRMRVEMERAEYLFETECPAGLRGEKLFQQFGQLSLVQPFSSFFSFSHSRCVLFFMRTK